MEYLLIIIVFAFIILLIFHQGRIFYYRNLKSYTKEIIDFLESHNYQFIEKRRPNNEDWESSPFKKPPKFEVSFFVLNINGSPVTWTDSKYHVVFGEKKQQTKQIWLEIKTTYFKKPQLKFVFDK